MYNLNLIVLKVSIQILTFKIDYYKLHPIMSLVFVIGYDGCSHCNMMHSHVQ